MNPLGGRPPADAEPDAEDAAWYVRRWLSLVAQYYPPLVEQLWLAPGDRVLDVACGPGALVGQVAPLAGPLGRVVGLDWSRAMLRAGARLARRQDLRNTAFVLGDMRTLPFSDASFDAAVCVLGLGGGDDPPLAVAEMRRVLRPGGRVATVTPAPAEHSPASGVLLAALARRDATGDYAGGYDGETPDDARRRLSEAGFARTGTTTVSGLLKRIDFDDFWADVHAGRLPGTALYRAQPAEVQAAIRSEVRGAIEQYTAGPRLSLPGEAVLAWGTAP